MARLSDELLKSLPASPGVYLMLGENKKILYVGKAKSIKTRVRSYFRESTDNSPRIKKMVSCIRHIDYMICQNEVEALILESNLIKKHKPAFNVILRDDKHYPYLKMTQEKFPRLIVVRRVIKDGGTYLGPFPSTSAMRETMKFIQKVFKLRQSTDKLDGKKIRRPCLNHQMNLCVAPCAGYISEKEYMKLTNEALLFLKGKNNRLILLLKKNMEKSAKNELFEEAAKFRDQFLAIKKLQEKQSALSVGLEDRDVISLIRKNGAALIQVLFVRGGRIIGNKSLLFKELSEVDFKNNEVLSSFITQYYSADTFIPDELIVQYEIEEKEWIASWLSKQKGKKVYLSFPKKGKKMDLIKIAEQNAICEIETEIDSEKTGLEAIADLKSKFNLINMPKRIEAFDISTISGGATAVGTMVVFINGRADKSGYRRYRIRSVSDVDDVAMMKEVLTRHLEELINNEKELPDLIILDGGKGQVNAVNLLLEKYSLTQKVDLLGIAKGKERNNPDTDTICFPLSKESFSTPKNSKALWLIQRVRDEAHRFSIAFHRDLRNKEGLLSPLDDVPGIGKERKKQLLRHFGSLEVIRNSSIEKIMEALHINEKRAKQILEHLGAVPAILMSMLIVNYGLG